ncbi:MAG: hypothetical protein ACI87E_004821, partial [Mariniblastus sp.]
PAVAYRANPMIPHTNPITTSPTSETRHAMMIARQSSVEDLDILRSHIEGFCVAVLNGKERHLTKKIIPTPMPVNTQRWRLRDCNRGNPTKAVDIEVAAQTTPKQRSHDNAQKHYCATGTPRESVEQRRMR